MNNLSFPEASEIPIRSESFEEAIEAANASLEIPLNDIELNFVKVGYLMRKLLTNGDYEKALKEAILAIKEA